MDAVLFGEKGEKKHEDRLADFTRDIRILLLAAMALPVGAISAVVAYALVWLIARDGRSWLLPTMLIEKEFAEK